MSSLPDDVPWPELGNVSRGATRGNQGQKGVLGPSDSEGDCIFNAGMRSCIHPRVTMSRSRYNTVKSAAWRSASKTLLLPSSYLNILTLLGLGAAQ